ncbi:hypothetical protein Acr_20g0009810 [Actinidia rufa]|uniref:Uncharacterized protein n=1 Tax=Actinidia rufa TaxID=165716 RepID=A0A7J0GED8_9ERIC|nr:hypothetical protein Acr_20g0009810 [Actinidia rufa]
MLPPIPSGRLLFLFHNLSVATSLPIVILVLFVGDDDKDKLHCDYCQQPRDTRETYWRLLDRSPTQGRGGHSSSTGGRGGSSLAHHSTVVESPSSSF